MLLQPEHLVVGFKHASWQRMQTLGRQGRGGAAGERVAKDATQASSVNDHITGK